MILRDSQVRQAYLDMPTFQLPKDFTPCCGRVLIAKACFTVCVAQTGPVPGMRFCVEGGVKIWTERSVIRRPSGEEGT
jgi:hypothetical protein